MDSRELFFGVADTAVTDFQPRSREHALAAFTLRHARLDALGPVRYDKRVYDAILAHTYHDAARPIPALPLLYLALTPDEEGLSGWSQGWEGVSSSLVLGGLLSEGLTAEPPSYDAVHTEDVRARLIDSLHEERAAGLDLNNLAAFPEPYSVLRFLRLLTAVPTEHAARTGGDMVRTHMKWCIDAYHLAK